MLTRGQCRKFAVFHKTSKCTQILSRKKVKIPVIKVAAGHFPPVFHWMLSVKIYTVVYVVYNHPSL